MADTIDAELAELIDEFDLLGDWEERYRHVIDLGKSLAPLTDEERNEAKKLEEARKLYYYYYYTVIIFYIIIII